MSYRTLVACTLPWASAVVFALMTWGQVPPGDAARLVPTAVAGAAAQALIPLMAGIIAGTLIQFRRDVWLVLGSSLAAYIVTALMGNWAAGVFAVGDFVVSLFMAAVTAGLSLCVFALRAMVNRSGFRGAKPR